MGLKSYLKENWGAPFVVGFMLLLIASAVQLSIGLSDAANGTAVYAFYLLVLGVALQIASYVKYGEGTRGPPRESRPLAQRGRSIKISRKVITVAIIAVLAGVLVVGFYPPVRQTVSHIGESPLAITPSKPNILVEPDGTTFVVLTVGARGGSPPYTFICDWADGVHQTSDTGIFQRTFSNNQTIPASADLVVTSSDGLSATAKVTISA